MAKTSRTATTKKASGSATFNSEETKLKELFIEELRDIYWAEKHLVKALPKTKILQSKKIIHNKYVSKLIGKWGIHYYTKSQPFLVLNMKY